MREAREASLDIARGAAIVAIVLGHVGRGLGDAGIWGDSAADALDRALYLAHLVVFVFVSGLLTPSSVARRGMTGFVWGRVRLFLYLYIVWSVIQGVVRVVLSTYTNTALTWADLTHWWIPRGRLWFLPFMAAATVALGMTRPWVPSRRWLALIALVVSLALWGLSGPWIFMQGWPLVGAMFAGAVWGRAALRRINASSSLALGVSAAVTVVVFAGLLLTPAAPPTYSLPDRSVAQVLLGAAASTTGLLVVLLIATLLARAGWGGAIGYLGRHSLAIYLAHILAASGTRIVLTGLGVDGAGIHLVTGVAAGVLLPLVLVRLSAHPVFAWLLDDRPLTSAVPRPLMKSRP